MNLGTSVWLKYRVVESCPTPLTLRYPRPTPQIIALDAIEKMIGAFAALTE